MALSVISLKSTVDNQNGFATGIQYCGDIPRRENMKELTFNELNLIEPLRSALNKEGYKMPTPVQANAIPELIKGRDLLGTAQTGTGKTAAFALPILQRLADAPSGASRLPRALILTPTRELAIQVGRSFATYGKYLKLRNTVVYGGVNQAPQARALSRGVDILVATPGRLLDLMEQGIVRLDNVEIFTLDEADRMLDMGFIHDVNKIGESIPKKRQTIFFSATMLPAVKRLADTLLSDPVTIAINPKATTADKVLQKVMFVHKDDKEALLHELMKDESLYRVLIFTRTKHRADKVTTKLNRQKVKAEAIHGNKSQRARQVALKNFKTGKTRALVATDVAARGIDVDGITHVINYELPNEPESYVHRIGRTARADAEGTAISFCDIEERGYLGSIEHVIKISVPVDADHPYHSEKIASSSKRSTSHGPKTGRRPFRKSGGRGGWTTSNRTADRGSHSYAAKRRSSGQRQP
ncbi:ATP-dependent RNA helicase RhlE [hydrothermal vent metagenome]|uniref:ATP-dependent RNA helicase RhlE n=1 Tax=hydrothermal vent metagenome TaxID=652676 RepID=A0A3B1CLZ4_9ZZZZ